MNYRAWAACLAAAPVLIAGCSSSANSNPPARASSTTSAPTSSAPMSSVVKTSAAPPAHSTSEFASIVSKDQRSIQKAARELKVCHGVYAFRGNGPLQCGLTWMTESLAADTLMLELQTELKDGPAPQEIASLVHDTITAAGTLYQAQKPQQTHCVDQPAAGACQTATDRWVLAESDLQDQLSAWQPYTH